MSHGANFDKIKAEPNLVPLLDVVLQLIMFFMLTVNFVEADENNEKVKLPPAQSGVPLDKTISNVLFLNMDEKGRVLLFNGQALDTRTKDGRSKIKSYLDKQRERAELMARRAGKDGGELDRYMVVLRADRGAKYRDVNRLLQLCEEAGYRRWQIRVEEDQGRKV
jgi:biopolymer transport protein ExbD